eukprot:TRINITY_DN63639_c0_g2_i1.p1 TRINITY_DN63639_c0_g2~~TRINITY_DN63639_c0_g2_i1.p1  ORF type:complete len:848 (+),score=99.77 TRINITY_DN63639_c0_g2_i1:707-3250(+)
MIIIIMIMMTRERIHTTQPQPQAQPTEHSSPTTAPQNVKRTNGTNSGSTDSHNGSDGADGSTSGSGGEMMEPGEDTLTPPDTQQEQWEPLFHPRDVEALSTVYIKAASECPTPLDVRSSGKHSVRETPPSTPPFQPVGPTSAPSSVPLPPPPTAHISLQPQQNPTSTDSQPISNVGTKRAWLPPPPTAVHTNTNISTTATTRPPSAPTTRHLDNKTNNNTSGAQEGSRLSGSSQGGSLSGEPQPGGFVLLAPAPSTTNARSRPSSPPPPPPYTQSQPQPTMTTNFATVKTTPLHIESDTTPRGINKVGSTSNSNVGSGIRTSSPVVRSASFSGMSVLQEMQKVSHVSGSSAAMRSSSAFSSSTSATSVNKTNLRNSYTYSSADSAFEINRSSGGVSSATSERNTSFQNVSISQPTSLDTSVNTSSMSVSKDSSNAGLWTDMYKSLDSRHSHQSKVLQQEKERRMRVNQERRMQQIHERSKSREKLYTKTIEADTEWQLRSIGPLTVDGMDTNDQELSCEVRYLKQGNTAFYEGDYQVAYNFYQMLDQIGEGAVPHTVTAANLCSALLMLGKNEECIQECTRTLASAPKCFHAYLRRARAHRALEELDSAICDLDQAMRLGHPNSVDLMRELQLIQLAKKERQLNGQVEDWPSILGVAVDATAEEIHKAYKQAAMKWHPDKWINAPLEDQNSAAEMFKRINDAYQALHDKEKREEWHMRWKKQQEIRKPAHMRKTGVDPVKFFNEKITKQNSATTSMSTQRRQLNLSPSRPSWAPPPVPKSKSSGKLYASAPNASAPSSPTNTSPFVEPHGPPPPSFASAPPPYPHQKPMSPHPHHPAFSPQSSFFPM